MLKKRDIVIRWEKFVNTFLFWGLFAYTRMSSLSLNESVDWAEFLIISQGNSNQMLIDAFLKKKLKQEFWKNFLPFTRVWL